MAPPLPRYSAALRYVLGQCCLPSWCLPAQFDAPADLLAWDCNCSICSMKGNTHVIVPASRFRLTAGQEELTTYTFNTHTAKHLFCKVCGVQAFYRPRSNPDGVAVTVSCISPGTVASVTVKQFDGKNWEAAYAATAISGASRE